MIIVKASGPSPMGEGFRERVYDQRIGDYSPPVGGS